MLTSSSLLSPPVVYPDGRVCISILHAPGDDPMGYESSAERWSPVQSVEKILLSVVSMLAGTELILHDILHGFDWCSSTRVLRLILSCFLPLFLSSQSRTMRAERTSTPLKCGVRTESSSTNSPRRSYVSLWAFRDDVIRLRRHPALFVCVCVYLKKNTPL